MALTNSQYETIQREYSRRQNENRRTLDEHRRLARIRIPRIAGIEEDIARCSADAARAMLTRGSGTAVQELQEKLRKLNEEQKGLLVSSGLPEDYLDMPCTCPLCRDTGYVDGTKCVCFRQAEIDLLYAQSDLRRILEKENFDHYSFSVYSDKIKDPSTGLTALQMAHQAYDAARRFVEHFDERPGNLFLYGDTGVGKTFLSHCIARELLASAHCVLYFSAYDLFERLASQAFSSDKTAGRDDRIFDCDLLIIDDLGTELTNSFVSSALFLCINERLLRQRSTVISTNLTWGNFSELYSERTFSRIVSSYQMIKLIGDDIRTM